MEPHCYIYLIHPGDCAPGIHKIGLTRQQSNDTRILRRMLEYPKNTIVYLERKVQASKLQLIEAAIIKLFAAKYRLFKKREYFQGDIDSMLRDVNDIITNIENPAHLSALSAARMIRDANIQHFRAMATLMGKTSVETDEQIRVHFGEGDATPDQSVSMETAHVESTTCVVPMTPDEKEDLDDGRSSPKDDFVAPEAFFDDVESLLTPEEQTFVASSSQSTPTKSAETSGKPASVFSKIQSKPVETQAKPPQAWSSSLWEGLQTILSVMGSRYRVDPNAPKTSTDPKTIKPGHAIVIDSFVNQLLDDYKQDVKKVEWIVKGTNAQYFYCIFLEFQKQKFPTETTISSFVFGREIKKYACITHSQEGGRIKYVLKV